MNRRIIAGVTAFGIALGSVYARAQDTPLDTSVNLGRRLEEVVLMGPDFVSRHFDSNPLLGVEEVEGATYVVLKHDVVVNIPNAPSRYAPFNNRTYGATDLVLRLVDKDPGASGRDDVVFPVEFADDGRVVIPPSIVDGDGYFSAGLYTKPGLRGVPAGRVARIAEGFRANIGEVVFGDEDSGAAPQPDPQSPASQSQPPTRVVITEPQPPARQVIIEETAGEARPEPAPSGWVTVNTIDTGAADDVSGEQVLGGAVPFRRRNTFVAAARASGTMGRYRSQFPGSDTGFGGLGYELEGVVGAQNRNGSLAGGVYAGVGSRSFAAGDIDTRLSLGENSSISDRQVGVSGSVDLARGRRSELHGRAFAGYLVQDTKFNYDGNKFGEDATGLRAGVSLTMPRLLANNRGEFYWGVEANVEGELVEVEQHTPFGFDTDYGDRGRRVIRAGTNFGGRLNRMPVEASIGVEHDKTYSLAWRNDLSGGALARVQEQQNTGRVDGRHLTVDSVGGYQAYATVGVTPLAYNRRLHFDARLVLPVDGIVRRTGVSVGGGGRNLDVRFGYESVSAAVGGEENSNSSGFIEVVGRFDVTDLLPGSRTRQPDLR